MTSANTPLEPIAAIGDLGGPRMLPGTRYRLENLLGDGGAGRVYRGTHVELDRPVAVKVLHRDYGGNPDYAARFRREARAASKIEHSGVVGVTDFGTSDDGRLFLVMELIEGPTLAEAIQAGPMGSGRALRIAANLCDVLAAVHQAGVVHRDVKPANLFMLEDDEVKLVDFGIARMELPDGRDWRITRTGKVVGTPGYMAPEHARGQDLDGRADLYALGAVLHEMLTGAPAFQGDSPVDVLMAQMATRPPVPSKVLPGQKIPRAVDQVVQRLLAFKAAERFQSAEAAAAELRRVAASLSATTVSVEMSDMGHADESSGRWRIAGAAVVACLLLAAGSVAGFFLLGTFSQSTSGREPESSPPVEPSGRVAPPWPPPAAALVPVDAGSSLTPPAPDSAPHSPEPVVAPRRPRPLPVAPARVSGEPDSPGPRRSPVPAVERPTSLRHSGDLVDVDEYDRESTARPR